MKKIKCSRCKKQITGEVHKIHGIVLCDECYPFVRDNNGKMTWKQGLEGLVTFGIHK